MIIEFKVNENTVEAAWLKTLYELIEELNCKCNTFLEETHNKSYKNYQRTRIVEVYGSETMVSWLKLRMERYTHLIDMMGDNKPEISIIPEDDSQF
ncbi:MAG: hypothetical protein A2Y25_04575 [Candidatus Melainabacteria bacterium GWF2_37_15]|nr:MAG: hypothetical protein A2Y25_04575 [Candidatus Melainabacteria bacterium GWF2_37_15]